MIADQPPPRDEAIIRLLRERDGLPTTVTLNGGKTLIVVNIAWGYDLGDEYAHVTTNISPAVDRATIDFFFTKSVETIVDPTNGAVLFEVT